MHEHGIHMHTRTHTLYTLQVNECARNPKSESTRSGNVCSAVARLTPIPLCNVECYLTEKSRLLGRGEKKTIFSLLNFCASLPLFCCWLF